MDPTNFKSVLAKERPTEEEIRFLPKVVLHEHLDGGLRPSTIIDIAKEIGYTALPTMDPVELEKWFFEQCNSGSLVKYLSCFAHTVAVMQRAQDLVRVSRECVLDLAADGVVYAELRYSPELFSNPSLDYDTIIQSVNQGFKEGMDAVAADNAYDFLADGLDPSSATYQYPIRVQSLLCHLRHHPNEVADKVAHYVIKYRDEGVCGFDIAGPENGFPPHRNLTSFNALRKENAHFTIHAGEDFGLPSIWQAIQMCGTDRLGHGVRLVDDIYLQEGEETKPINIASLSHVDLVEKLQHFRLGRLAAYVRDKRITLEICPTSNLQTGCIPHSQLAHHPIHLLSLLRFRITVNTDNRLMSSTSMTKEFACLVETFKWTFAHIQRATINAVKSSFLPFDQRVELIKKVIKPAYRQMLNARHEREKFLHIRRRRMSEETDTDEDDDVGKGRCDTREEAWYEQGQPEASAVDDNSG